MEYRNYGKQKYLQEQKGEWDNIASFDSSESASN